MVLILFSISQLDKFCICYATLFNWFVALMNGYASCFLVCKQLWFISRGGEEQRTCDLWLVPLHYIPIVIYFLHVVSCVNRPMTTKPTYNHNYINYQHHPPPPSSSTCAARHHGCGCPWKPPVPSGCRDVLMAVWVRNSGATAGRGHWVWGTTRKGTWSVGVGTSCKRDVLTATTLS